MFGPPKDVEGQCNEWLELGDQYGDGTCIVRCQLPKGHEGPHEERFTRSYMGTDKGCPHTRDYKTDEWEAAYDLWWKERDKLLDEMGLDGERLEMCFVSGGMGETFANVIREMSERLQALGPSPLKNEQ